MFGDADEPNAPANMLTDAPLARLRPALDPTHHRKLAFWRVVPEPIPQLPMPTSVIKLPLVIVAESPPMKVLSVPENAPGCAPKIRLPLFAAATALLKAIFAAIGAHFRLNVAPVPAPVVDRTLIGFAGTVRQFPGLVILYPVTPPPEIVATVTTGFVVQPALNVSASPMAFPVPAAAGVYALSIRTPKVGTHPWSVAVVLMPPLSFIPAVVAVLARLTAPNVCAALHVLAPESRGMSDPDVPVLISAAVPSPRFVRAADTLVRSDRLFWLLSMDTMTSRMSRGVIEPLAWPSRNKF